jgi:prophage regulatory protein
MEIWRIQVVKAATGYRSTASIYNNINAGLWTKPVRIGQRSVGWPSDEVVAVNKARVAGATDEQLRQLVIRLHAKRTNLLREALE